VAGDWKTLRHVLAPAAVVVYCPRAIVLVHPRTDRLSRQDRELALSFTAAKQLAIWLVYALDLVEIFLGFLCKSHVYIVKVFVEKGQKTMTYLDGLRPEVTRQHGPHIKPAMGIR
jgi:hypothetical protein